MLKKIVLSFTLVLFLISHFFANERSFVSVSNNKGTVEVTVSDGIYIIKPFSPQIIKVNFIPTGQNLNNYGFGVVMQPLVVNFEFVENSKQVNIITTAVNITIHKNPFQITYSYNGNKLVSDYFINDTIINKLSFKIDTAEVIYGAGARVLGMNRRGNKLELYNRAHYGYETHSKLMNYSLPMVISSRKYALIFDNPSAGWLDIDSKQNNTISFEPQHGVLNYYVVADKNWPGLVSQITALTGRMPMPALWTFGNFSSRFGYRSQQQVLNTINKFKTDSIPVDAVIIDIYWFGSEIFGHMGNLDWHRDSFPDPIQMLSKLDSANIKTVLVTEPFILTTSKRWDDAVKNNVLGTDTTGKPLTYDFYFGNTGLVDVFNPRAQKWFWNIYKGLAMQGVAGWWGDLGEPEVHPAQMKHFNGTANQIHNAYGHQWAGLIYDGYKSDFPNVRPFILMRAGFLGSQRYGMVPWTGDVNRTWGGLKPQPEIALQMGLQGLAYTHSDLGGFAGEHKLDNELYTRWLQYGVFQPVYRPHAQDFTINIEPVFQDNKTKQLAKQAIELRYKLLPYNYNLAYINHISGMPLMRPMFFAEPDNNYLLTYDNEYLWGDAFVVSPVKDAGKTVSNIYLPNTGNWFDYYTAEKYKGGQTYKISLVDNYIPVFVKAGEFIATTYSNLLNTQQYKPGNINMVYYFDNEVKQSSQNVFFDDGKSSKSIENKEFKIINFSYNKSGTNLEFNITDSTPTNKFNLYTQFKLTVKNMPFKPNKIIVGTKKLSKKMYHYNISNNELVLFFNNYIDKKIVIIK